MPFTGGMMIDSEGDGTLLTPPKVVVPVQAS